ncbi:MAG: T9SS type A sorting domain-containing protein, partial [Bacteroidales bacterium]|nr:T9SS type A sorting domain-containing protein [Bacteroidales bacterium]
PIPTEFSLNQNFPNPFNSSTTINYSLPKSTFVNLKIFNLMGKEIETLVNEYQYIGEHQVNWQPKGLTNGIYIYKLMTGNLSESSEDDFSETKILMYQQ